MLHAGPGPSHIHHLHAHQWLHSPNSDDSSYLDSQLIVAGSAYTMEIAYGGSGNRNLTVGDSIFHCHFYPHFAMGMWSLWRVHDVFEGGTELDPDGRPAKTSRPCPTARSSAARRSRPWCRCRRWASPRCRRRSTSLTTAHAPRSSPPRRPTASPGSTIAANSSTTATRATPSSCPPSPGTGPRIRPWTSPGRKSAPGTPELTPEGTKVYLNGGLPRHQVTGGKIVKDLFNRWDFTRDFVLYNTEDKRDPNRKAVAGGLDAYLLPEEGTPLEKAAMRAHSRRTHATVEPNGDPGNFTHNGLPGVPGGPVRPARRGRQRKLGHQRRRYKAAVLQLDVVLSKKGWHFPQQRFLTLWQDVADTIRGSKAPEPFFFRANTGDSIEFWHTNLVPSYYELDDFQVRTPTDVIGQHIHLVKFDVTSSDGAGNGFNYEDGTFSPDEVRDRIEAINLSGGLVQFDASKDRPSDKRKPLTIASYQEDYKGLFGPPPAGQNWNGASDRPALEYDPLLNDNGHDRTLRTVFTHDHFGPSTHQQAGLYAGLLVEPSGSTWYTASGQQMNTRDDGGPTSWTGFVVPADPAQSYREFALEFQDMQLAYDGQSTPKETVPESPLFNMPTGYAIDLDAGRVTPAIRDQFKLAGIILPYDTKVEKKPQGQEWTVTANLTADPKTPSEKEVYPIKKETLGKNNTALFVGAPSTRPGWSDSLHALAPPGDPNNSSASNGNGTRTPSSSAMRTRGPCH